MEVLFILNSISTTVSPELDRGDKNTRMPEMGHTDDNIIIFSSLGGGCAVAGVLFGIVVGIVISKKKKRQETNIEMPSQTAGDGKCLIGWTFTHLVFLFCCQLIKEEEIIILVTGN